MPLASANGRFTNSTLNEYLSSTSTHGGGGNSHYGIVHSTPGNYEENEYGPDITLPPYEGPSAIELARDYNNFLQQASYGDGKIDWDYNFGVNKGTLQDFINYYDGWHIADIRKDVKLGIGEGIHFVFDKATGKFIDMKHMLVAGQFGNVGGLVKEFQQLFETPGSAFNKQDLFSNNLGNYFYLQYGSQLMFHPRKATEYISKFLSAPKIFRYSPIPYKF